MLISNLPSQAELILQLKHLAQTHGFADLAISGIDLSHAEAGLTAWLEAGFHGEMAYMAEHGLKRARPAELLPGTVSVLTLRMDYLPSTTPENWRQQDQQRMLQPGEALVSRYARGRDYHKVLRTRLQKLVDQMQLLLGPLQARVFTDSAPVLEVEIAKTAGLGWRGKHSLLLQQNAGSLFFLGEIFINIALTPTAPIESHCGTCTKCITECPTQAIVAPYKVDARRCISYLTIEHDGPIPLELRSAMGNRIYGCDDCQLVCPWNKFAQKAVVADFAERNNWGQAKLIDLLQWSEATFLNHTEGSPIRRIGYQRWSRNLVVATGNALASAALSEAEKIALEQVLSGRLNHASELLQEHIQWALSRRV
jgi:epoxyqueuosine reductase